MIAIITAATLTLATVMPAADGQQAHIPLNALTQASIHAVDVVALREARPANRAQVAAAVANANAIAKASAIPAQWQQFADCVATRESHHNPKALNRGSGAAGKWQFMPAWRRGLPHMVAERLASNGATPRLVRRLLASARELPINKWKEHYQDIGFVAAITSKEGMGWKHWYLAGSPCNSLVPRGER